MLPKMLFSICSNLSKSTFKSLVQLLLQNSNFFLYLNDPFANIVLSAMWLVKPIAQAKHYSSRTHPENP